MEGRSSTTQLLKSQMFDETPEQKAARMARNAASLNRPKTDRFGAYNKREKGPDGRYLVDTLGRDNTEKRGRK